MHVRNHRIRRAEGVQAAPAAGPRAARISRLRLRRDRAARGRRARVRPRRRQPPEPEGGRGSERLQVQARPRPHALGDARRRHRGERAPADRLRRLEDVDRPERDRRELPRAARGPDRRRAHVHLRDRRRDRLAPDRAPLRRRSHGGGPAHVRRARGPLHLRRHPPRPPRRARRRAPPDAARGRDRQRRDVPRLERGRVPEGDAPGAVPRRRRHRHDHPRGLRLHPRRRLPGRARPGRARLGRRGRREGRLRDVHAQGDLRAVRGRRRDDRRPRPSRHARARRARAFRGGAQGAAPDRHPRVRHRVPRRASSAGT